MKKRIFSLLIAIALIITLFPQTLLYVNAVSIASGTSEENLQWELDSDGVLIISGTGAMKDYLPAGGGYPSWLDANIGEDKQYIDKVILSPGITNIGEAAFAYCSTITSIEIPNSVTEIGDYAFLFCGNLKEIVIPDSVVSIGELSLCGCGNLSSIDIPASVNSIGVSAFKSCDNLDKIVFAGNAPTVDNTADMDVFEDVVATAYYPRDNSTWTAEVMRSFGGKVAWEPYDAGMGMKDNVDDGIEGVCTPTVEEVEQMVADYYNRQYQDEAYPGTHVVFHGETTVSGNTCNMVVHFQSSSSSPTTAANVLVAFVSVDMRTGVMIIENMDGDVEVQLFDADGEATPETPKYVLCAYAANVDLTVSLSEEMKVSYAMFLEGEHTNDWEKPVIAIADDGIISVTQCEKNSIGYAVMIKGKKAGGTHLTVTDGDSGASVTIYITVRDTYTIPISYIIDDVPSFTPEISLAKDVQTNIWDCNGLYVNGFPGANEIQKVDGNYLLEFNVYNESSMYGSIDVYDKNNNWIRSYPIEKYTGVQGMYDALEGLQYLVKDTFSGNLLNYTSDSQSAYTRVEISVPEGGYFTISNNYLQSPGAYLYNSIDIIFTGANLSSDMMGFFDEIASQISSNSSSRDKFIRILTEQFGSMALKLSTEVAIEDYGALAKLCHDSFLGIMDELGIDFWGLAELCFNIAEDVLKEFFPEFIEKPLDAIFTIQKLTDAICQIDDIKDSPNQPYIFMYTPEAEKGITTMNGVTVIPGEGVFADNAVLQVFRISDSGNIVASDSGFVVDQYELYHICYTVDNNKVQPNGTVTIKIPIPATFNKESCDVYHQQPDGSWELVNARIEGDFIVFKVDHFSLFAVVNSSEDNGMTQNNASEDKDQENSDSMRIPLDIIGMATAVLLIVVAVVIVKKRR